MQHLIRANWRQKLQFVQFFIHQIGAIKITTIARALFNFPSVQLYLEIVDGNNKHVIK